MANVQPAVVTVDIRHARSKGIATHVEKQHANRCARRRLRLVTRMLADDSDAEPHRRRGHAPGCTGWDLD